MMSLPLSLDHVPNFQNRILIELKVMSLRRCSLMCKRVIPSNMEDYIETLQYGGHLEPPILEDAVKQAITDRIVIL